MTTRGLRQLLRECAALFAVLTLVLGPLALATSRSLGAAEKIAVAAGMKPFAACMPGSPDADPAAGGADGACDHCTAVQPFTLSTVHGGVERPCRASAAIVVVSSIAIAAFPRAPPARGPPAA